MPYLRSIDARRRPDVSERGRQTRHPRTPQACLRDFGRWQCSPDPLHSPGPVAASTLSSIAR